MAKTDSRAPQHAKPLGRFRLRFVSYYRRDGTRIVRSWPRKRPGDPTPIVKAWQEDLKITRRIIGSMSQCTTKFIEPWLPRSGYTLWDWLNAMHHGKGMRHKHPGQSPNMLPYLFRDPPSKMWEGAPRILTPTAKVKASAAQNGVFGAWTQMPADTELWDTNDFWRLTPTPGRITIRAAGLYQVTFRGECYRNPTSEMTLRCMLNGATELAKDHDTGNANFSGICQATFLYYFNPLDYITLEFACGNTGVFYTLTDFSIVAITPETIF